MSGLCAARSWPALALGSSLAACAAPPPASSPTGGVEERVGAALPLDATFTSSEGRALQLGELIGRGKPALLVMAYSRCTMLCSLVLQAAADVVPRLELALGRDYSLVTISIDPKETPDEAARTQALTLSRAGHADDNERWPFLVGSEPEVQRVAAALGFRYVWDARSEQYAHPAVLFAISPEGRVAGYIYELRPEPAEVRAALLGQGHGGARAPESAVLSCFRFDALGRKYGAVVQRCFQGGALAVALGLGLGLGALFRRERRAQRGEGA